MVRVDLIYQLVAVIWLHDVQFADIAADYGALYAKISARCQVNQPTFGRELLPNYDLR